MAYDVNNFAPRSGRVIGEDGQIHNIVDLIKQSGGGGGDMLKETYDTNDDGKVDAAENADSVTWDGVTGKPSTYPPETHNHAIGDIESLQAELDDLKSRLSALEGGGA